MAEPKLLTISGSLRKGSFNRMLLREAAVAFGPAQVVEADLHLPLYDGDLEQGEGVPEKVSVLTEQIQEADAILIASPEYNKGISGVLKNALDWVSRVPGNVLSQKPTVVISAAAGRTGGEVAQFMTMSCLAAFQVRIIPGPGVLVAGAGNEFDETGKLTAESYRKALAARMEILRKEVSK